MGPFLKHIALMSLSALVALSCTGNVDQQEEERTLVLTPDRTVTYAGGDPVSFSVMYGDEDLTGSDAVTIIYTSEDSEVHLGAGENVFSPQREGTYVFTALYNADEVLTSEPVEITVTADKPVYREYDRQILAMQFTSVGCPNCPVMSSGLKTIQEEYPDKVDAVSFHQYYNGVFDPMECDEASLFSTKFNVTGLPQCYIDMHPEKVTSDMSDLRQGVETALARETFCGIAVESNLDETSGRLSVTVKVTSNRSVSFRYLVFLVEDGIEYTQYGITGSYVHNNVVRDMLSTSSNGERLNAGKPLIEGIEYESSRSVSLDDGWKTENMRIVATALVSEDGGVTYVSANTISCPLGGNADYAVK